MKQIIIIFLIIAMPLYSQDAVKDIDEYARKIKWDRLFDTFIKSQDKLINHNFIAASYGLANNVLPSITNTELPYTNSFALEYGFVRVDSNYNDNIKYYSSEFAFIEDNTNKIGPITHSALYNNDFSWGLGLRSGFSNFIDADSSDLFLLHSTAFMWSYMDYDGYNNTNNFFKKYDNQYKFGMRSVASVNWKWTNGLIFTFEYEHNNLYSQMEYGKWVGAWTIDFFLQRWIDLLDPIFIDELNEAYPFVRFFYKNAIAIIFSEIRKQQQFFPFSSDYSLLQRKFNLKLTYIF